jgi:hypothetical protein
VTTLSVVIVSSNAREQLRGCLDNLKATLPPSSEVIVVDNASRDGSARMVAEQFLHVRLVRNPHDAGYAVAANRGAAAARGAYVLFLAPQVRLMGPAVRHMQAFLEAHLRYAAVVPSLVRPDGQPVANVRRLPGVWTPLFVGTPLERILPHSAERRRYYATDFDYSESGPIEHGSATCFLMRRKALKRERVFDEHLWLHFADADVCARLRAAKWRVGYLASAVAVQTTEPPRAQPQQNLAAFHHDQLTYFRRNHGRVGGWWVKGCVALAVLEHCLAELYRRAEGQPEEPLLPVVEGLSGFFKA